MQDKNCLRHYDIILFWVGVVSAFNIIMLCLGKFSPAIVLISGTAAVIFIIIFGTIQCTRDFRLNLVVLLLLVIALLPRSDIYTYYSGGQDEGLYVNMSATMIESGKVNYVDRLSESLPDNMKESYDSVSLLGVGPVEDPEGSIYSVDFYPMHPAWMALSTFIFGEGKHTLSLLFFSLLGLLGMYLLTMELTNNNNRAGYLALLFGAVNPGMAFFSKFPVGEMIALCFTVNGFYLLLRSFKENNKFSRVILLLSSGLLFTAFCYTRMTFPLIFPIFCCVLLIVFFVEKLSYMRIWIVLYTASLCIMFFLSWLFYIKYQPGLGIPMYQIVFQPLIDKFGDFILIGILLFIALLFGTGRLKNRDRLNIYTEKLISWLENYSPILFSIAITLSVFSIVKLYSGQAVNPSPLIFHDHSLYSYMLLLSPMLSLILYTLPFTKMKLQRCQVLLILFITLSWLAVLMQSPKTAYLYYYGRYLISEMIPYSLIMCGIILAYLINIAKWRKLALFITCISVLYFSLFSAVQIGKTECEDPQALYDISNIIGREDVVVYRNGQPSLIATPLRLYFDKQIYPIDKTKLEEWYTTVNYFFDNSNSKYGNVYLLENAPLNVSMYAKELKLVGKYNYTYHYFAVNENKARISALLLPVHNRQYIQELYLYRLEDRLEPVKITLSNFNIDFSKTGNSALFTLSGISDQEEGGRWIDGQKAVISTQVFGSDIPINKCQIKIDAGMYTGARATQRFTVIINGIEVGTADSAGGEFIFDVPVKLVEGAENITIELLTPDAHSPSSAGESNDPRVLGLSLRKIQLIVN